MPAERIAPAYWINMGALAITALAGSTLATADSRWVNLQWNVKSEIGKILPAHEKPFVKTSAEAQLRWFPQARARDYRVSGRASAGAIAGQPPFEEFYSLGMEHDNDLYLRGHSGTHDGKKGAGPLGTGFLFFSTAVERTLRRNGFWDLSLGPFFDTGRTFDAAGRFGLSWLCDAGLALRFTILDRFSIDLSYGRALRGGGSAFFTNVTR